MTNAHRTITALLAVIAVLLAINLVVIVPSHEAQAQGVVRGRPVEAVALQADEFGLLYRMFSDGTVERNFGFVPLFGDVCVVDWCGWEVVPEMPLP